MNGEDEIRIILLGKTGVGKSSVGNLILGENKFTAPCSPISQTQTCEKIKKITGGRKIVVIDTPGISDMSTEEQSSELISFLVECAPGPHVIIIVMDVGRQSRENQLALDKLLKCFTVDAVHHMVLLFTHGYDLDENMTIHDFIHKIGTQTLKDLAERCGNRIHIIDNKYWNENSRVSDVLASLQGLSEEAIREIAEKMPNTSSEETPWLNVLSDQSVNVETEKSEEQSSREYRTNRYQLTQLMKSIKSILDITKGQPCSNKALEEIGKAINIEVENILKELGAERETEDMVEIRRRARERVRNKLWRQLSGVAVGTLLGALLGVGVGVAAPVVIVAGLTRAGWRKLNDQGPQAGGPPVQKAGLTAADVASAEAAVGISATKGSTLIVETEEAKRTGADKGIQSEEAAGPSVKAALGALAAGVRIGAGAGVLLFYGAVNGGASGYKVSKTSDNPKQAADNAAKAVVQNAGDVLKTCWNLGNTETGDEDEKQTLLKRKN